MKSFWSPRRYTSVLVRLLFSYALLISGIAPFASQPSYGKPHELVKSQNTSLHNETNRLTAGAGSALAPSENTQARSRAGELLVRFRAGVSQQQKDVLLATHGARRRRALRGNSRVDKLELPAGQDPLTVALQMKLNPQVEFAEPNFLIDKDDITPDDSRFAEQWALSNTGQNGGQYGSDIAAPTAWQTTTGSHSTVIAVIDSGIDFTHPDLANNEWTNPRPSTSGDLHGWDYISDSATIIDEQGHGTAIAGILAAQGNNGVGVSGVMWQAALMSLRVLDNTGTGNVADAVEAIDYASTHGAQVINISWGTTGTSGGFTTPMVISTRTS